MLTRVLLIICFFSVNISYAIVSSYQIEIEIDTIVQESSKRKQYTPEEIEQIQIARRNQRNAIIAQKMDNIARPKLSKPLSVGFAKKVSKSEKREIQPVSGKIIIALIILIFGAFMLIYAYSHFSRKKVDKV
jgi:ABC-type bacteriocin/lantibiotic exporter with double-glycine peptidase domain